jgi:hypothetical protein
MKTGLRRLSKLGGDGTESVPPVETAPIATGCLHGNVYNIAHLSRRGSIGINRLDIGCTGQGVRIFTGSA